MKRIMLKSKIHRAFLTGVELDYEGSITIDSSLLKKADLLPGEQVHVLNLNNGSRIVTYIIEAPAGSRTMMLNGPAARMGAVGDPIIVLSYAEMTEEEARTVKPRIIFVDENNRPK
ncbi:MAG: aspartate 1-decarboxylase [Candidatus Hinthialibacter sp.]